jgi:hypothetical protein
MQVRPHLDRTIVLEKVHRSSTLWNESLCRENLKILVPIEKVGNLSSRLTLMGRTRYIGEDALLIEEFNSSVKQLPLKRH